MPSQIELARMQQTARERLPDLALIERPALTNDDYGGEAQSYQPLQQNVPCRVNFRRIKTLGSENPNAAQGKIQINFPAGTDVKESDKITIGNQVFVVSEKVVVKSFELTREVEAKKL